METGEPGGGGTTMPQAYIRIRTRAAAVARECLNTALPRPLIVPNVNVQRTTSASHTTLQVYSGAQDFAMFSYSILFVWPSVAHMWHICGTGRHETRSSK